MELEQASNAKSRVLDKECMQVSKREVIERMRTTGVVPVLRGSSVEEGLGLARAIAAGGIDVLEITLTNPHALEIIRTLRHEDPSLLVGAGTVLDAETARACILEGAQFIVSPSTNLETIALCRRYSCTVLPGALTPTEIMTAWEAGADIIKLFPANAMGGAAYLRSIRAPLPQVQVIPTGGISLANAKEFLEAGAVALGVGADLADAGAIQQGNAGRVTQTAREYRRLVLEYMRSAR